MTPGDHPFHYLVELEGIMRQGEDFPETPTRKVEWKKGVALLLQRMGFQRDKAMDLFVGCMTDALNKDAKIDLGELDRGMALLNAKLGELPKVTKSGQTTLVGDATVKLVTDMLASVPAE